MTTEQIRQITGPFDFERDDIIHRFTKNIPPEGGTCERSEFQRLVGIAFDMGVIAAINDSIALAEASEIAEEIASEKEPADLKTGDCQLPTDH